MNPKEKKKQLKECFKKRKELNKDNRVKTFSNLGIHIDKEILEGWRNNR